MKYLVLTLLLAYYGELSKPSKNNYNFYPNLPFGEYHVYLKAILFCNSNQNYDIQTNLYLNRKSKFVTELKGNMTLKIPFDDSLTFQVNFAVKDSIGGWKDNAFLYKSPMACTTTKKLMGVEWSKLLNSGGLMNNTDCPVPPGVYVSQGYDLSNLGLSYNVPKIFYYGTYKVKIYFTDKRNNYVGCIIYVIVIKRLWEIDS